MPGGENGFRFQYSVAKTEAKGLGVFAREPIEKGSIVWCHVQGAFAVYDERSFRAKIEKMRPADVVYELTHVHAFQEFPACLVRALDDGILINHSYDPNLATQKTAVARTSFAVTSHGYLNEVADDDCPPYYDALYEQYGVREEFLDDC